MKESILILILIFFTGCINKNGLTIHYNNDCHIEYDNYGSYNEVCPNNFYNFKKKNENKDCLQCN